ncbi:hypothetical protein [Streptomyces griseorubiginosus]|uniref:hypothetical protein n=1 Tax=Streptomyces griseorubiginosus TaxID=67304 RepID=UPI00331CB7DB
MDENVARPPAAPPPPAFPAPWPIEPPPLPPKQRRTNAVIIGSAVAVIAAIVTTGIVVGATKGSTDDGKPSSTAAASGVTDDDPVVPFDEPDPEPTYPQVDADSFSIDLRTTQRQCFGSAGCNVTVEPELTYSAAARTSTRTPSTRSLTRSTVTSPGRSSRPPSCPTRPVSATDRL